MDDLMYERQSSLIEARIESQNNLPNHRLVFDASGLHLAHPHPLGLAKSMTRGNETSDLQSDLQSDLKDASTPYPYYVNQGDSGLIQGIFA